MRVLAIDSSGLTATVAIVEDDTTIAEFTINYNCLLYTSDAADE